MLILTRRLHESIIINDNIKVTLTYMKKTQVKLGISAPKDVIILRSELTAYQPPLKIGKTKITIKTKKIIDSTLKE